MNAGSTTLFYIFQDDYVDDDPVSSRNPFDFDNSIFADVNDSVLVNDFHKESEEEARELMDLGDFGRTIYDEGKISRPAGKR